MDLPKISIVMPVLNVAETIERAIQSVLIQQYPNLEIIIMDGGSTDQTTAIIEKYADQLTYWHSKFDGNPAIATNWGIAKARGDLIGLLMGDDWYEPGILHKVAEYYVAYPNADMFTCAGRILSYNAEQQTYQLKELYDEEKRLQLNLKNICLDITSAICCRFIKRDLYIQLDEFKAWHDDGSRFYTNDKEFLIRAVLAGAKDVFIDYLGHTYLAHPGSHSFSHNVKNIIRFCEEHLEISDLYCKEALNAKDRFLLQYWYNDQSARLIAYLLLTRQWRKAGSVGKTSFKKYHIFWLLSFVVTSFRILIKKSLSFPRFSLSFPRSSLSFPRRREPISFQTLAQKCNKWMGSRLRGNDRKARDNEKEVRNNDNGTRDNDNGTRDNDNGARDNAKAARDIDQSTP